ncbi:hypothetical protein [Micromonospora sp. NBC_01796]|uniref:hypothetical protein n=1 Tax=Micromonospora sp. NBC_01796 TaxID=2975987 RepID=UPI002DDC15E7|nr:hypothetical protein [Micromonospora sp. NBC_01796]WSA84170.1 hypothetical protein OIE47_27975 [Micromonospora sp. NBC_01796]
MSTPLPKLAPMLLVEAVDALPARLRRKVDDMVVRAAGWPATLDGDRVRVRVDEETEVVLAVTGGVVRSGADVTCGCLLAPNCLHRAAVLARCPVQEDPAPVDTGDPSGPGDTDGRADPGDTDGRAGHGDTDGRAGHGDTDGRAGHGDTDGRAGHGEGPGETVGSRQAAVLDPVGAGRGVALSERQVAAADDLWRSAVAVLCAGRSGSGVVVRAALVRAAHQARIHGLHRAAAVARQCANRLQAAAESQPQYRLADLTDDLRELLDLARRLRLPDPTADLLGTGRRSYETAGGLRLYGVCTVPVVADSGYGGVVTYLVDRDGRMWTIADLMPGGAGRASTAGDGIVTIGEVVLSHRELARAGIVVSGATSSENGQLGAGKAVRAVRANGAGWAEEPVDRLWREPYADQVHRAFAASAVPVRDRPAGGDLLFLRVEVVGVAGDAVLGVTPDGLPIALGIASDHEALPYRDNLRVLAGAVGADLRVIGRLDPHHRTTVQALAVAPAVPNAGLVLPARWSGRADLGFDRLHRSQVRVDPTVPGVAAGPGGVTGDPALHLLRRQVERVVDGGRAVQALAAEDGRRLRGARLDTGAVLLAELRDAAGFRDRDVFGRITADDGSAFAEAWLAAAVYERAASAAFTEASWLPTELSPIG